MPVLWIYQASEYASGSEYVRVLDYAWLCLNVFKSVWMAFVLDLLIVIPYLKERSNVFLESKKLIFVIGAGSIWFCLLFSNKYFYK